MLKAVANRAYKAIVACALGAAVVLAPAGASARQWQDAPVSSPIALAELPKEAIAELMDRNEKLMERLSEALTRHRTASREQLDRQSDEIAAERSPVEYLKRLKAFFGKG